MNKNQPNKNINKLKLKGFYVSLLVLQYKHMNAKRL